MVCGTEGPRAPLFCAAFLIALSLPTAAQDVVERAALQRCASLPTATAKLSCFELLIAEPDTAPEPARATELADISVPDDKPRPVEAAEPLPPASTTMPSSAATPDVKAAAMPEGFGREHLDSTNAKQDNEPEAVKARVMSVEKRRNRLLYFAFDNGQVWRQMESGYFPYPREGEFDVTIRQGVMGDYQLRAEDRGRMLRIVRVK